MKPKRIRITKAVTDTVKNGGLYDVIEWEDGAPKVEYETRQIITLCHSGWEPVQGFQHGDPVWAWDVYDSKKAKAIYIGAYPNSEAHVIYDENERGITSYWNVEHRKPVQKTMTEIAETFGTTPDNFEIIEE